MADEPRAKRVFRAPALIPKLRPFTSGGQSVDVSIHSDNVSVDLRGLNDLAVTLRSMPAVARDAAGYEMANIAADIIDYANEHFVPLWMGPLKDSGDSDEYQPGTTAEITTIAMWYGAPQGDISRTTVGKESLAAKEHRMLKSEGLHAHADPSEYALEQHENLTYKHTPPPDETGPKYLERAVILFQDKMAPRIAQAVMQAWGGSESTLGALAASDIPVFDTHQAVGGA